MSNIPVALSQPAVLEYASMAEVMLKIDEMLKERGRSAYWLANELGMGHGNLYKYRKGKVQAINLDLLGRICELLECKPGNLLVMVERKPGGRRKGKKG